jgi:HSP20 family protein
LKSKHPEEVLNMKENKGKELEKQNSGDVEQTQEGSVFIPATDIYEKDDAILVRCDMPGVEESQVDVTLDHYELTITGRQVPLNMEKYDLLSGEYDTGTFRRTFKIPQQIDREKIKARLHCGVLDIALPKAEQAQPKKITVTTGG